MIDHSRAFRVSSKVPVNLKDAKIVVSEINRLRLKFLNYENLTKELSDYLEKYQITSILKRRDLLLEMAEAN